MTDKYILEGFEAWLSDLDVPSSGMCIGRLNEYRTHMCKVAFEAGFKASQSMCSKRVEDAVMAERARCFHIARGGCLLPPDGGSPTDAEIELTSRIADLILSTAINSTDTREG